MRHLPSLNSLRAFEAAARHMSFTRAANELHVTSAAISQQIRSLEDWTGTPLFRRLTRAIRLTEAAQGILPQISEAFDQLADVSARLKADTDSTTLVVSAVPTFAAKWLVPRLSHFNDLYPDINVRIDTKAETFSGRATLEDFDRDDIHVAICLGDGDYPGMKVDKIVDEDVAPACSPALISKTEANPIRSPNDLRYHRLLRVDWGNIKNPPSWSKWFESAGINDIDTERGPIFTIEYLAISAALAGQGVVLASTLAIQDDLKSKRLIQPFEIFIPSNSAFWVVAPERTADRPKIAAFRRWVLDEIAVK